MGWNPKIVTTKHWFTDDQWIGSVGRNLEGNQDFHRQTDWECRFCNDPILENIIKKILKIVTRIICDLNILIFDEASDFGQRLGCQQRMVTWVTCSTELWPVPSHHFCSKSPDICSGTWTHAAPKFVQCIIFSWRAQIRWWISVLRSDRSSLLMHVLFHIFICVDIFLDVRTYPWPWLQLYSRILPKNITI
jgi:hypothetical protein